MIENKTENKEIMEQESPTTETPEMTAEVNTEATEDVIVEAGAVCDEADEIIVDEAEESGEDELVVEAAAPVRKGMRRRSIALIAAIICMLAVAVGGTYAYFTASKTTVNVITMRGLDLVLHEVVDDEGTPFEDVNNVMPGNSVPKIVYVENFVDLSKLEDPTDEEAVAAAKAAMADFYTRIKLEFVFELNEEVEDPDGTIAAGMVEYVKLGYNGAQGHNKADWTEKDGYYYYTKDGGVVKPGEVTTPLFGYVTFDKTMGNEYQNAQVIINVIAEATQVKNNDEHGPTGAAW